MSHHPFRKTQPRRAILDDTRGETGAAAPGVRGYVKHGLVALAMSAMGLAMIASVAPNSATQAAAAPRTSTVSTVTPDHSTAMIDRAEQAAGAQAQAPAPAPAPEGTVDAFGRSAESTSRSDVREEIDRAVTGPDGPIVAEQQAATEAALQRVQEAEAEKRKQEEEALKRQQEEEAQKRQQAEEAAKAAKAATAATTPLARGSYSLGSGWGAVGSWSRYHTGQDLAAPVGTPIHAVAPGVVSASNAGGWAGNHVIIKHSDGSSLYAHMASKTVNPGQEVKAGDLIGYVGMTGRTFGPHLHFEYYPNGANTADPYTTKDPYAWLAAKGVRL